MTRSRKVSCLVVLVTGCSLSLPAGLGAGTLGFEELPMGHPTGNYAAVAMGDIDGDGFAELLSGRREKQKGLYLFTYKNKKWARQSVTDSGEYGGVALADVTGDKLPDVLAVRTSGSPKGLVMYRSVVGKGRLRLEPMPSPYQESGCDDLTVGDIDADGDLDIALATGGKGLKVLVNDGKAGSFRVLSLETGTYEDTAIGIGDANGDRRLDVIASNHPGKNPRLFLCSAAGQVSYDRGHIEGLNAPCIGFKLAFSDLDGDGKNDLIFGTDRGLRIYKGNGCRGPEATWWQETKRHDRGSRTMMVCVGDVNKDGKDDLAFSSDRGVMLLLNRGGGAFSPRLSGGLPAKGDYSGCYLFDWDGDGDLDLACSSFQGLGIRLFRNRLIDSAERP